MVEERDQCELLHKITLICVNIPIQNGKLQTRKMGKFHHFKTIIPLRN